MFALITGTVKQSTNNRNATTDAIDTTGAVLLTLVVWNFGGADVTVSDSKGNTWTSRDVAQDGGNERVRIYDCVPTSVGAGHTFGTIDDGSDSFPAIAVAAWSGAHASPFDQVSAGASQNTGTTLQPGSATPAEDNELFVTACNTTGAGVTTTIDEGFTELHDVVEGANASALHWAYKIQTAGGAQNPTFTSSGGAVRCAVMGLWKAAAGAATLTQSAYQFLEDDAGEGANTPLAAENTPVELEPGTPARLRVQVDASGDPDSKDFQLEYRKVGDSIWRPVPPSP